MDLDTRARCWIATFPWNDATTPTDSIVPNLPFKLAHAKFNRVNDLVSIWFTFVNPIRASTITNAVGVDHIVVKQVKADRDLPSFQDIPFDWELVKTNRDEPLDGELVPQHSSAKSRKRDVPIQSERTGDSSDDELQMFIDELVKGRKRPRCECVQRIKDALARLE